MRHINIFNNKNIIRLFILTILLITSNCFSSTYVGNAIDYENVEGAEPACAEGRTYYDNNGLNICMPLSPEVIQQVGTEGFFVARNIIGSTIVNGTVVFINGADSGFPTIDLAKADSPDTADRVIGIATHDIDNDTEGYITRVGEVRDLDTSLLIAGSPIYLSDTVAGEYTTTKPSFPNYIIRLGEVKISDVSIGELLVNITGNINDIDHNFFNGSTQEPFDFTITSNGTDTITGSLEQSGGGDITLVFSDGRTVLDTTPADTIVLTAGTDVAPQIQYLYVPFGTGPNYTDRVLTKSLSGFPTSSEYVPIADCFLRSASTTSTDGALVNRNWNDHLAGTDSQGHLSHINEKLRTLEASWRSGVALTVTEAGSPTGSDITLAATSGLVFQLHEQTFPAIDMATTGDIHIVNEPDTPYETRSNLYDAGIVTADNDSIINNRYFNLIIWGAINKSGEASHLMANLPTEQYVSNDGAVTDASNGDVYNVPSEFQGKAFLISKLTFQKISTNWVLTNQIDLRGSSISISSATGGGGATISSFSDGNFNIYNTTDPTKIIITDVSGVTTATTRTGTFPDNDFTFGGIDQNLYETFAGDSGSTIASTTTDTLNIVGTTNEIDTIVTTDTVTLSLDSDITKPIKTVIIQVSATSTTALATGDAQVSFFTPSTLNGMDLVGIGSHVFTVSSSGLPTFQVSKKRYSDNVSVDMLTTESTIDINERGSSTATTPAVIDTSNDNIATDDEISIDVDVAGTGTAGAYIYLNFKLP